MLRRLLPWKYLASRMTKQYGLIDPFSLLARLRKFSQPSEVQEPLELLREGIKFHARGLVNTRAIQHNLDWIWPYWVERQFNPQDISFIPRAFSFSHINLTHRNWTAVGLPDLFLYPIIDPRGLVTPFHNGWSLDFWIVSRTGLRLIPSKLRAADQSLHPGESLVVNTRCRLDGMHLGQTARMLPQADTAELLVELKADAEQGGWLYCVLRPYNPEGIQFIEDIRFSPQNREVRVNHTDKIQFVDTPDKFAFSDYQQGDVLHRLDRSTSKAASHCDIGMATAAFGFGLQPRVSRTIEIRIPLAEAGNGKKRKSPRPRHSWKDVLQSSSKIEVPDERMRHLFETAKTTLVLLSTDSDIVPGPFTYRRFWFRDACLMLHALMNMGMMARCRSILNSFPARQTGAGYFHSQEGEWDSNGQVLWIFNRFRRLSRSALDDDLIASVVTGGHWIEKKLVGADGTPHNGLLPPGFSAEHLGPNDYYYWDDFWSIAGLTAAAEILEDTGDDALGADFRSAALNLKLSTLNSIATIPNTRSMGGIPASPYRRMDAGAVGSLVADYPLQLFKPGDPRIKQTIRFLLKNCFVQAAFFQDMTHSGINAYLTLAIAQTLLRMGDKRYRTLLQQVADLASETGHWPEAIHPGTGGGCMGDGQHGWAAAEWVMMIRNLFVREERHRLIIASGVLKSWIDTGDPIFFGPTPTPYGTIGIHLQKEKNTVVLAFEVEENLSVEGEIRLPGYAIMPIVDWTQPYRIEKVGNGI